MYELRAPLSAIGEAGTDGCAAGSAGAGCAGAGETGRWGEGCTCGSLRETGWGARLIVGAVVAALSA